VRPTARATPSASTTTWLDPGLAVEHARAILEAFAEVRPQDEAAFREAFASLEADLVDLDRQLDEWSRVVGDTPLIFSHPVYQYLTRRYELNAVSLHWEPDVAPVESQWRRMEELIQDRGGRWMIWEGRPLDVTVERLRSSGIESVVLATCANTPHDGDYLEAMQRGITALKRIGPR
jgi:zinc transport system substrate-binding protein